MGRVLGRRQDRSGQELVLPLLRAETYSVRGLAGMWTTFRTLHSQEIDCEEKIGGNPRGFARLRPMRRLKSRELGDSDALDE
jgi:hypothetical protein